MRQRLHPAIAGLISVLAVIVALVFSHLVVGEYVLVPILDAFIEARRASGESVGVIEAVSAFILVMGYMLVITILVGIAALSGWVVSRMRETQSFSIRTLIALFGVEEPN